MKKPWLAFLFSLIIPGAGLAYLGKWKSAALNFVLVQAVILVVLLKPVQQLSEHFHYIVLALHAASAGVAHAVALRAGTNNVQSVVSSTHQTRE
jgi:hypothetical protein